MYVPPSTRRPPEELAIVPAWGRALQRRDLKLVKHRVERIPPEVRSKPLT